MSVSNTGPSPALPTVTLTDTTQTARSFLLAAVTTLKKSQVFFFNWAFNKQQ